MSRIGEGAPEELVVPEARNWVGETGARGVIVANILLGIRVADLTSVVRLFGPIHEV